MRSRLCEKIVRPSVCLRLYHRATAAYGGFAAERRARGRYRRRRAPASSGAAARRSAAANASSVAFTADVGS